MDAPPVRYVTTSDGYSIAYTVTGKGPPLVFLPQHWSHVLLSWQPEINGPWWTGLSSRFELILYDHRGNGLSTRGLRDDHSMEHYQRDLDAVFERLQPGPSVLFGVARGAHVAVRYALRHPENVAALVLLGAGISFDAWKAPALYDTVPSQSWETFLRTLTASAEERDFVSQSVTQDDWLHEIHAFSKSDIEHALPEVHKPCLILHLHGGVISMEESTKIAGLAQGQLVLLEPREHKLGDYQAGVQAIESFVNGLPALQGEAKAQNNGPDGLSSREVEVLRLVAGGMSNKAIATELVISPNTVAKHITSILTKARAQNRAEAVSYAHRNRLV